MFLTEEMKAVFFEELADEMRDDYIQANLDSYILKHLNTSFGTTILEYDLTDTRIVLNGNFYRGIDKLPKKFNQDIDKIFRFEYNFSTKELKYTLESWEKHNLNDVIDLINSTFSDVEDADLLRIIVTEEVLATENHYENYLSLLYRNQDNPRYLKKVLDDMKHRLDDDFIKRFNLTIIDNTPTIDYYSLNGIEALKMLINYNLKGQESSYYKHDDIRMYIGEFIIHDWDVEAKEDEFEETMKGNSNVSNLISDLANMSNKYYLGDSKIAYEVQGDFYSIIDSYFGKESDYREENLNMLYSRAKNGLHEFLKFYQSEAQKESDWDDDDFGVILTEDTITLTKKGKSVKVNDNIENFLDKLRDWFFKIYPTELDKNNTIEINKWIEQLRVLEFTKQFNELKKKDIKIILDRYADEYMLDKKELAHLRKLPINSIFSYIVPQYKGELNSVSDGLNNHYYVFSYTSKNKDRKSIAYDISSVDEVLESGEYKSLAMKAKINDDNFTFLLMSGQRENENDDIGEYANIIQSIKKELFKANTNIPFECADCGKEAGSGELGYMFDKTKDEYFCRECQEKNQGKE